MHQRIDSGRLIINKASVSDEAILYILSIPHKGIADPCHFGDTARPVFRDIFGGLSGIAATSEGA